MLLNQFIGYYNPVIPEKRIIVNCDFRKIVGESIHSVFEKSIRNKRYLNNIYD